MDEKALDELNGILKTLIPDSKTEIHSVAELMDSPDPAVKDLREIAELVIRLSKGGRG